MVLAINNDELQRLIEDLIRVLGASLIPESTFIDLSSEGTVALLTRLRNIQDRNLKVIGYLEFEFSEGAHSCNGSTSQEGNCSDVFVGSSIDRCDHADLDLLSARWDGWCLVDRSLE